MLLRGETNLYQKKKKILIIKIQIQPCETLYEKSTQ